MADATRMSLSEHGLRNYPWRQRYATSQLRIGGPPVNILHDFYIPALQRSKHYDRIAGYFSSTSLAAASQGFSRFVANQGKARFIVGTQLNFDDIRTILEISQERIEQHLLEKLADDKSWPGNVQDGVALLAWMLRNGHLDIRVGIRKHQDDETIQSLDFSGDGYMHEKWAIFGDGEDELLVSGSLNESVTALSINAENLTLQPSWVEWNQEVIRDSHRSFEALWKNEHPAFEVYALPEAVRKRLVKFADRKGGYREIDGTPANVPAATSKKPSEPETTPAVPFSEQVAFALIRLAPLMPGGQYVGMETAPVTPWPHQRFVARRLIDTFPCNHLLCDEVGLGKTIEAGLAFRSLWLAGMADSIRIFCPASLTSQWMHEMAEKFLLPFRRRTGRKGTAEVADPISGEVDQFDGSIFDYPLEIISTGLIIHQGKEPLLERMPKTDLVILDEAHKARRAAPDRQDREASYNYLYRGLKQALYPLSRCLLLATATPMQLNQVEAFDLLKTMPSAGVVQFSEDLCAIFYQIRSKLLDSIPLERYESEWLRRYLADAERSSPVQWKFVLEHVLDLPDKIAIEHFVKHNLEPPMWGSLQPALSMLSPLGRSMLRHNRQLLRQYQKAGLLKENLAFRDVLPKLIELRGMEREVYDELQDYCGELSQQIGANQDDSQARAAIGFYLSFLRLRFASSFPALRLSLQRRIEKIDRTLRKLDEDIVWPGEEAAEELSEDEAVKLVLKNRTAADLNWELGAVEALLRKMDQLPATPQKTSQLLQAIQNRRIGHTDRVRQMVVFTRYADTLDHLREILGARLPGCPIGTFSGDGGSLRRANSRDTDRLDRTMVRKRFMQGEIDILLCTDAAAEGLNLQSADLLVNFDLPWNPMLLEQRIGRIDRIGQHHKRITVHNYLYQGSVEEVVYLRLVDRFRSAMEVAGELQFSLLPVQEQDFQDYAKSAREPGRINEEGLIERAKQHAKRIVERQKLMEFDARKQREVYDSIERFQGLEISPVSLEKIWKAITGSVFLKGLGCSIELFGSHQAMRLQGLFGIEDGTLISASRELYEKGLPAGDQRMLHFSSYGDLVFERLLENFLKDQTDVATAWAARQRIRGLAVGEKKIASFTEAADLGEGAGESIRVLSAAGTPTENQTDRVGRVQKRVLMDGVAEIAEQKLSPTPETPAVQLARIDSFHRDLAHRTHQSCLINLQPKNASETHALSNRLLWPVHESAGQLQLKVDPLFLFTGRSIIERALQKLEKPRRTGAQVAVRLRDSQ